MGVLGAKSSENRKKKSVFATKIIKETGYYNKINYR